LPLFRGRAKRLAFVSGRATVATKTPTQSELEALWNSIGEEFDEPEDDDVIDYLRVLIRGGLDSAVYRVPGDPGRTKRLETYLSMVENGYESSSIEEQQKNENTYKYVVAKLRRAINKPVEL
jgi:hypothetical protein